MLKIKKGIGEDAERAKRIREYVAELRSPYEKFICEKYLDGWSLKQIATAEGCTVSDIEEDLKAAMEEIAEELLGKGSKRGENDA